MIKTGLVSITLRDLSIYDVVDAVQTAKLDGIEWSAGEIHVPEGDMSKASEVRKLCADSGISIPTYGSYYRVGYNDNNLMPFEKVLDSACELGAKTIRVWAGAEGSQDVTQQQRYAVIADMQKISDMAKKENISITVEYHEKTLTDSKMSTLGLIDALSDKNVKFSWQPPVDLNEEQCSDIIASIGNRLGNIHVFNWERNTNGDVLRLPLELATKQWHRYLSLVTRQIPTEDYYALLEFVIDNDKTHFFKDAEILKSLVNSINN